MNSIQDEIAPHFRRVKKNYGCLQTLFSFYDLCGFPVVVTFDFTLPDTLVTSRIIPEKIISGLQKKVCVTIAKSLVTRKLTN